MEAVSKEKIGMKYFHLKTFVHKYWEVILLSILILLGCILRLIHFEPRLEFLADQGLAASRVLEIWQNKELTLLGPSSSYGELNRKLFFGSVSYYFQIPFMLLANWDPLFASVLFALFSCLTAVALFYGTKKLCNVSIAFVITSIYLFVPSYITYTQFLWNPNFLLALTPIVVLLMSLQYCHQQKYYYQVLLYFAIGLQILFHYQYIVVLVIIAIFQIVTQRHNRLHLFLAAFGGLVLGVSPMILFEVRNNFYNTRTFFLILQLSDRGGAVYGLYYWLSSILILLIVIGYFIKDFLKRFYPVPIITGLLLISFVTSLNFPERSNGWYYKYDVRAYEIIRSQQVERYSVVNLVYDTLAQVQRYFHRKDGLDYNFDAYTDVDKLFVIAESISDNPQDVPYEINSLRPYTIQEKWLLNEQAEQQKQFYLYLLQKQS